MNLKDVFSKNEKTADYFIKTKVEDMIERSVLEGKKREQIEDVISDECADPNTEAGSEFLGSIADFSEFPKYTGRGIQDNAPDLNGSLSKAGEATLTMWFSDVAQDEVEEYIKSIEARGFVKHGQDYVKETNKARYTMSVSTSVDKLRIFHMIQKKA